MVTEHSAQSRTKTIVTFIYPNVHLNLSVQFKLAVPGENNFMANMPFLTKSSKQFLC